MENSSLYKTDIKKVTGTQVAELVDILAIEEPLEIQVSYRDKGLEVTKSVSVTMRTPGQDKELAAGFLFTEGILLRNSQLAGITAEGTDGNKIRVQLAEGEMPLLKSAERNFYTTSSCGVCGKSSIDAIKTVSQFTVQPDRLRIRPELLHALPALLREKQEVFDSTGGLHASALFDIEGRFMLLREDVGRHNALDKVIGATWLSGQLPLSNVILLLSGRASFELVQKAVMAGIKIIAAVGAPSSLAVSLAKENNITLVGFLRNERFNIYAAPERILTGIGTLS